MKKKYALAAAAVLLAVLACNLAAPAATPTSAPPTAAPTAVPTTATSAPAQSFAGAWSGPDPDDGSDMTLTLTQTGSVLVGTYVDSYSGSIPPPGYNGTVTGSVISATSAQIVMNLSRHDGATLLLQIDLTLNADDTLTVDVTSTATSVWILRRQ